MSDKRIGVAVSAPDVAGVMDKHDSRTKRPAQVSRDPRKPSSG